MADQTPGQVPMQGLHQHSPGGDSSWGGHPQGSDYQDEGNPLSMGFLRGLTGMQKKATRDGQTPKRRGPKPDSKPAQTRRQELNRQAQRTHRERKEQYVKTLELEVLRQKESFVAEMNRASQQIEQQRILLHQQQGENGILRKILMAKGIPFEHELDNIRMSPAVVIKRDPHSASPSHLPHHPGLSAPTPVSALSPLPEQAYANGSSYMSGLSPSTTMHGHSPAGPEVQEFAVKSEREGTPDVPGIFEKDPQLGIDFILQLEQTCRDHDEYLLRRSLNSPDTGEEAQICGHALMASCPPIGHVKSTPAIQGGIIPTYEHKVPDAEMNTLRTLLNLSTAIHADIPEGQVTPVEALQCLRGHRNYQSLNRNDVMWMINSIKDNVRCYGFGAVMEDFELRDALTTIFASKPETYEGIGDEYNQDIDEMYS